MSKPKRQVFDYPMAPVGLPRIWLVFDLSNGHAHRWDGKGYCWWFRTKKAALEHIRWQRSLPSAARLSNEQKYQIVRVETT